MSQQPLHSIYKTKVQDHGSSENEPFTRGRSARGMMNAGDLEASTQEKQRKELQLLIAELKDRDRELNDMVAAHQQQLAAWERDRQQALMLEKKNVKREGELKKKNEQIRLLLQRLKVSESKHKGKNVTLESTQARMKQLENDMSLTNNEFQDIKGKNESLNTSLTDLSTHITEMESREQELAGLLRVKEAEKRESCDRIAMLGAKLHLLDSELQDSKRSESRLRTEVQDERSRFKQSKGEMDGLKTEMLEKTNQVALNKRDISKLKDEIHILQKEINLRDDEIRRKDDLIDLQKSKQDRADKELAALRAIYERQQQELASLHVEFCDSQGLLEKQEERLNEIGERKSQKKSVSFLDGSVRVCCKSPEKSYSSILTSAAGGEEDMMESNCSMPTGAQERMVDLKEEGKPGQSIRHIKSSVVLDTCDSVASDSWDCAMLSGESQFMNHVKVGGQVECLGDWEDCGSDTTNDLLEEARRSATPNAVVDEDDLYGHIPSQSSPTSKLQKLLAESREMVNNLERAASTTPLPRPNSARAADDQPSL